MDVWGDVLAYGDTVASAVGFPNGLTRAYRGGVGLHYLPEPIGAVESVNCVTTIISNTLVKTSVNVSAVTGFEPWFNASVPNPLLFTTVEAVGRVFVDQGVKGYSIVSLTPRALQPGEILLPGLQAAIALDAVAKVSLPTT